MSNNANKVNSNPMKVITGPETRWSYANVWEAKSINGGTPKFSVSLIIPKSDTMTVSERRAAYMAKHADEEASDDRDFEPPVRSSEVPRFRFEA